MTWQQVPDDVVQRLADELAVSVAQKIGRPVRPIRIAPVNQLICDFCSRPEPLVHLFPADGVYVPGERDDRATVGPWAACAACSDHIHNGDVVGLARRSVQTIMAKYPPRVAGDPTVYARILRAHRAFGEARITGPPIPQEVMHAYL